jgi:hypothetical protein
LDFGLAGWVSKDYPLLLTAFCPTALCSLPSAFCLPREGAGGGVMLRILPFVRQLRDEILAKTRQMAKIKFQKFRSRIWPFAICPSVDE